MLIGEMCVAKFKDAEKHGSAASNVVRVYMANLRIPEAEADILITMNVPTAISALSSSAATSFAEARCRFCFRFR